MQIQMIEEKTGLDRATIRYYEQEGLIKPKRLQNGYRDYSEKNLQDLMKIKLLRQLGLSLEAILQLMEGKDDLKSALENQLIVLKDHKAQVENAKTICKMIVQDNVTYETIVPNKYYIAANENKRIENPAIDTPYTEYVYLESHPVRRFAGRYLDQLLSSAILMLVLIVLLRVRPFGEVQINLLSVAALFLTMPINALFLCLFGTTPGKFAVGIFLKTPEGKNMSYQDALKREWAVFRYGMGFNLPIYSWIRLYKSYNIHTEGRELEWDYDYNADVLYTEWGTKRWLYTAVLGAICTVSIIFSAFDSQFPKYRSTNLTLSQFAENYNDYAKENDMITYLSEGGEWYTQDVYPNSVVVDTTDHTECWEFITDENQKLEQISIEIQSNSKLLTSGKMFLAIRTAVMSQPDIDIFVAEEVAQATSEMIFIFELGTKEFDFGGVIVNMEFQQLADIYKSTVNIIIP